MNTEYHCPNCQHHLNNYLVEQKLLSQSGQVARICPDCDIKFDKIKSCYNENVMDYVARCTKCDKVFVLRNDNKEWQLTDPKQCPFGHAGITGHGCIGCGFSYDNI